MSCRRSLAAVLSVGALFLPPRAPVTTSPGPGRQHRADHRDLDAGGAAVTIALRSLPRGRAGGLDVRAAARRRRLRRRRSSSSTRATATWPPSPATSTSSRSTSAASSTSSTAPATSGNGEPFEAGDGEELAETGADAARRGRHRAARPVGGHRHQRLLRHQEHAEENGSQASPTSRAQSVVLAAAPDCEGRLDCEGGLATSTASTSPRCCRSATPATRPTSRSSSGESDLGQTSTTDGTLESLGLVVLDDDKQIQPAQNLVPAVSADFLAAEPGRRRHPQPADGRPRPPRTSPSSTAGSPSTARSPRTSPATSWSPRRSAR